MDEITAYSNEELIAEIRKGHRWAEERLVEQNRPMIYKLCKDYYFACTSQEDMEDIFQAGCLGLIKAVKNYDATMGTKFITYAYYLIRGEVQRLYQHFKNRELNLSAMNFWNEDGELMESSDEILDYVRFRKSNQEEEWTHSDSIFLKILLDGAMGQITKEQQDILRYRYYEDLSQREVGLILDKSQVYVSREEKRARKKLLALLVEKECIF